ncbi:TonB-dependent hemoglobin/transferrin/lactoferrin family receptor [Pseudoduganella rhizocola]|uniref:TonB-dependent hemoglobin/transferrin/lactoferrin family receptor n=1 Tax=Pseudoduganella rhizocola TaxID=3382643 RepID=UPI0038B56F3D
MAAFLLPARRLPVLMMAALGTLAYAQNTTNTLGEILVTAKRDEAVKKPGSTTTLGADELSRRAVTDMANIARYEPLISVPAAASGAGNIWDGAGNTGFNIRGIDGNRVSLDLDGIALPDAAPKPDGSTLNSFGIGRDYFDPETFREVRIASGTTPAGAGTPGLGGSVAFVTRSPEDYVSRQKPRYAEYHFSYDGASSGRMHALTGAAQFDTLQALAVLVHRNGKELKSEGTARANPDDWSSDALLAKLNWSLSGGQKLGFTIDAYRNEHDREYNNKQGASYPEGATQHSETRRNRFSIDHEANNGGWFDTLESRLYVQDAKVEDITHARYITGNQPYVRDITTGYFNKSIGFASNAGKELNAATQLAFGISAETLETRRPWREDRTVIATGAHQITSKNRMADMDTRKLAAFLRGEFVTGALTLTPGIRAEHRELKPKNLANYVVAVPAAAKELKKESDSTFAPSFGASYELKPDFNAYAHYSRGTRLPTAAERTGTYDSFSYTGAGNGYAVLGNANLKKETSNAFELGVKGDAARGLNFKASVFRTEYKDFIEYASQPPDPVNYPTISFGLFRPENIGRARTWGGEFSARADLGKWSQPMDGFSVALAAGVSHGKATNTRTGASSELASTLPSKISSTLAWDDPARRGGVALTAVHARAKQAGNDVISGVTTPRFAVPSSTVVDLVAYWNVGRHAALTAGLYNLGDRKYWDYASSRGLPAGTTAVALADIERQARPGRNVAVNFKLMY